MQKQERALEPADAASRALREAVEQARQLADALERTSTRRVLVRIGDAEITIEREPRPGSAEQPSASAPASAARQDAVAIVAPLVGIFYRGPSPKSAPFVEPGDTVEPGQVIGIVEAMKVMNQVVSDQHGSVVEILVENGSTVHYEQPLMLVESG